MCCAGRPGDEPDLAGRASQGGQLRPGHGHHGGGPRQGGQGLDAVRPGQGRTVRCLVSPQASARVSSACPFQIEMQRRRGKPLPPGWAQGPDGAVTADADLAYRTQCLMPLGGAEDSSGYKGYGLALMVETFCGLLSGKPFGVANQRIV